jgi:uncharacterized membrane protein (UPF0136 family)
VKLTGSIILVYSIVIFLTGVVNFIRGDNIIIVFIISGIFGGLLFFCSMMIFKGNFTGVYMALIIAFALGLFFGLNYTKHKELFPSGIVAIISMFSLGFTIYALSNKEQITK